MTSLLEHALGYARRGRRVFPVGADKRPLTAHGFKDATIEEKQITAWWAEHPEAGIATPTGDGLLVLDIDSEAGEHALAELGELPPTWEVVTRRGRHLYFRGDASNSAGVVAEGVDVRGEGGYVVLPPSPHPEGAYEWRTATDEVPLAPSWLLELIGTRRNGHAAPVGESVPVGLRNSSLTSMAGTMRRRGFEADEIAAALLKVNANRCKPPMPDSEVWKVARSVTRYKPAAEIVGSLNELAVLLGLDTIGKRIDTVRVIGRGTEGALYVHFDDASRFVIDPIRNYATGAKLTNELALQTGATRPVLKQPEVTRVMALLHGVAHHEQAFEDADRAADFGISYLKAAPVEAVRMSDQGSRWAAFSKLDRFHPASTPEETGLVLEDPETRLRYVRCSWFNSYVMRRSGPGEARAVGRAVSHLGWEKPGSEGLIKATAPGRKASLSWAFYKVSPGWEER